jgi:hypothetical protein
MNFYRLGQERLAKDRPVTVELIGSGELGSMSLSPARLT